MVPEVLSQADQAYEHKQGERIPERSCCRWWTSRRWDNNEGYMMNCISEPEADSIGAQHVVSAGIVILGAGYGGLHVAQRRLGGMP